MSRDEIPSADETAAMVTRARLGKLAKPPGSLGALEELAIRLAAAQHRAPPTARRPRVVVFAGDHGVARAEAVSPYPAEVTHHMLRAFASGGAAVAVLAREATADLEIVDVGVAAEPVELSCAPAVRLVRQPVSRRATGNIAVEDAMTNEELAAALTAGTAAAARCKRDGVDVAAVGEIGIGNTTSAAAMAAHLLGVAARHVTGPGTGLDEMGLARKTAVVDRALERCNDSTRTAASALCRLGGYEIAAMTGFMIEAARRGLPVLVDGFVAGVAALAAVRLEPGVRPYLVAATRSTEPGHDAVVEATGLARPLLDLRLRLGEASGAAMALSLARAACAIASDMITLDEVLEP